MILTLILTLTFGLLVWVDFFFSFPDPLGMRPPRTCSYMCALTETIRAYLGAVSTCWWMQSESARGESNTGVPF